MELKELVVKCRTFRRFEESFTVSLQQLESLVDLARLSPTGGNRQPLKYLLYNTPEECDKVFPFLAWAGYLREWQGPEKGERPSAYVVILGDKTVTDNFGVDHGIAGHSILLGAVEAGLGGCMIQSIMRADMTEELRIPDAFEILLVIALGKPVEEVVLEQIKDNDVKYWRDGENVHHVPKRELKDIILRI